jgi:hypothetical protein
MLSMSLNLGGIGVSSIPEEEMRSMRYSTMLGEFEIKEIISSPEKDSRVDFLDSPY